MILLLLCIEKANDTGGIWRSIGGSWSTRPSSGYIFHATTRRVIGLSAVTNQQLPGRYLNFRETGHQTFEIAFSKHSVQSPLTYSQCTQRYTQPIQILDTVLSKKEQSVVIFSRRESNKNWDVEEQQKSNKCLSNAFIRLWGCNEKYLSGYFVVRKHMKFLGLRLQRSHTQ